MSPQLSPSRHLESELSDTATVEPALTDLFLGPNEWLSGGYRLEPQGKEYARELLRVAGPDRLVWASDCPFVGHEGRFPYKATINWLVDAIPDATARAKIFGRRRAISISAASD